MSRLPRIPLVPTLRLLAVLALLAPAALAQVGPIDPSVDAQLSLASAEVGAGNTTTLEAMITNTGRVAGSVTLALAAPEGWTATAEPASFALDAGASEVVQVTLTAPAAGAGAAQADLTLAATIADAAGRTATAEASLALTRVDPLPPPPPTPWFRDPVIVGSLAGLVVALVGGALFVAHQRKQARLAAEAREQAARAAYLARETGVALSVVDGPHEYGHRREMIFRIGVANTSERPRVAVLEVEASSTGWRASVNLPKIDLQPGARATLVVLAEPDGTVAPGEKGRVVVRAKPEEAQELWERVELDVTAPQHRGPASSPNYRLVSVQRSPERVKAER